MKRISKIFLGIIAVPVLLALAACSAQPSGGNGGIVPPPDGQDYYVVELNIIAPASKTIYYPGESVDLAGIAVEAVWNDGVTETLSTFELEVKPEGALRAEDNAVTLEFEGASVFYQIEVRDVEISSLSVSVPKAINARVACGSVNDFSGAEVCAAYSDGEQRRIFSYETVAEGKSADISSLCFSSPGIKTVTVGYAGKTAQFTVDVFEGFFIEAENIVASDKVTKYDVNFVEKVSGGFYAFSNENEPASGGAYMGSVFKGAVMRFHIYAEEDCSADIFLRASSGYMTLDGGSWSPVEMGDQLLCRMFSVNYLAAGQTEPQPVHIGEDIVLKGGSTENPEGDPLLYVNWENVKVASVDLKKGDNVLEFTVITDYVNCRGQEVACNIDRMEIEYSTGKGGAA